MKEIHPRFADEVDFIVVNIGYGSGLAELAEGQGYPWPIGQADTKMMDAFGVTVQSTKIAIDNNGVVVYRAGYGQGTIEEWYSVFHDLMD